MDFLSLGMPLNYFYIDLGAMHSCVLDGDYGSVVANRIIFVVSQL